MQRVAGICGAVVLVTVGSVGHAASEASRLEQLMGTWRGTSVCTDRVAAPACRDETVVYEFSPGAQAGTVHWLADKVVKGERARMYELDLAYDNTEACWKAEYASPRVRIVWRLVVDGQRMTGTLHQLPGNELVRKLDVWREPRRRPSS